jgi:hypothetical protein
MGHAHAHGQSHGEGEGTYFLDQLFTILVCGAVGLVAIMMYQTGMLKRILVPMFFVPVLLGGIAILVLAAIRAIAIWQLAGARGEESAGADEHAHDHAHSHSHSHGHEHAHAHEDCGHEHGDNGGHQHAHAHAHGDDDHGHDHGWAPWRYMVLAIPVFLYFLGLPREGFSSRQFGQLSAGELQEGSVRKNLALLAGGMAYRKPEPRRLQLRFKELTTVAAVPSRHEVYDGDIGILRGQFAPIQSGSDREFTLYRVNMTCCAADAVFLETRIIAPDPVNIPANQWVQVEGVISFQKNAKGKWVPVITLKSNDDIRDAEATTDTEAF